MPLFDIFWAMLMLFLFIAWIWVLISVISDLFRDHETRGVTKAIWAIFILLIPWLGVLVYILARGDGMAKRRAQEVQEAQEATRTYIRETAGTTSVADELHKLGELRDKGTITDEEFQTQKASLLA